MDKTTIPDNYYYICKNILVLPPYTAIYTHIMNRTFSLIAVIVLSLFTILSCTQPELEVPVDRVSINQPMAEMEIGETIQLSATVSPSNATRKEITWSSSKKSVASVSDAGLVTALAEGNTIIYATADGKTAECAITVSKPFVEVTSISLDKEELSLIEGDSETLIATVKPDDATDKTVTWSSTNSSIATVENGKVTAIKDGTATITAKAGQKQASCVVTVAKKVIAVESVELNKTSLELIEGDSETLVATVKPDNATDKTVTWSSTNSSIATVENGKVTAIKEGSATITAKAGEKQASCVVSVAKRVIAVESVELNKTSLELIEGDSETLTATVKPDNATDKTVTWSSTNSSVATVEKGKVSVLQPGGTIISAQAGDKTASCKVTVAKKIIPVTGITLNKESIYLTENRSELLQANINPSDATNTTIIWDSSDKSVAVVYDGQVQSIGLGKATISAKTEDGGYIAYCEVNVIHLDNGAVDLGFSVKWASCNIGATTPEDAGFYFAWADPVGYVRNANNDGWVLASNRNVTHSFDRETYQASSAYSVISDIKPDSGHDSARENWGDGWRMPSSGEFNQLKNNCDSKLISLNGKEGFLFTSKKTGYTDKSIFLPIRGGFGSGSSISYWNDSESYYWTNHYVNNDEPTYFKCGNRGMGCYYGSCWSYMGLNIRAVK